MRMGRMILGIKKDLIRQKEVEEREVEGLITRRIIMAGVI